MFTHREQSGSYFEHKTFQSPQRTARMMSSESIKEHRKRKAGYTWPHLKSPGSKKVCLLAGPLAWLKFLIIPLPQNQDQALLSCSDPRAQNMGLLSITGVSLKNPFLFVFSTNVLPIHFESRQILIVQNILIWITLIRFMLKEVFCSVKVLDL